MGGGVCTGRTVLKGYGERGGIFLRTKKFKVVLQILPLNLLRCANISTNNYANKIKIRPIDALFEVLEFTTFLIYLVFQFE